MTSTERFSQAPVAEYGTPENTWSGRTDFPPLDDGGCPALVLVAPHPDDEILGVGGWASALAASGVPVTILSVTDGEASHPGSPTLTPPALAALRRAESDRAAGYLGLPTPTRLGLPDGGVAAHEAQLAELIRPHLAAGVWCAAPLRNDGHPDHEASYRAAAHAAQDAGALLIEYPIWLWHWSFPGDEAIPWHRARRIDLAPERHQAKVQAAGEFITQVEDLSKHPADRTILPQHVLARLLRDHETVFAP